MFIRKKWWIAALSVLVIIAGTIGLALPRLEQAARDRLAEALRQRFHSDITWRALDVSLLPRIEVAAEDVSVSQAGQPALIKIRKLTAVGGLLGLLGSSKHLSHVQLEGLVVQIPPRKPGEPRLKALQQPNKPHPPASGQPSHPFIVDEIRADGAMVRIMPKDAWKAPLEFDIGRLRLHSVGPGQPMEFHAVLRNAKPPGMIDSEGRFGPWNADDPGATPVSATYRFKNADLGVFKGIAGTLSSTGRYRGQLNRLEVDGTTDTPNFMVKVAGQPLDLKTEFHAIVDGLNGDTTLQPVTAHFLQSTVVANGDVAGKPGEHGKTVSLQVTAPQARVQDLLQLAVRSKQPTLTGGAGFNAKLIIPPGDEDIASKIRINATFAIDRAHFTSFNIQEKLSKFSKRARGDVDNDSAAGSVASGFTGAFQLQQGVITFSNLTFTIPGVSVRLAGTYGLHNRALDFEGSAAIQAKVSQMTTGLKSKLLKVIDPLFERKNAGTWVAFHIGGTREKPDFDLDLKRTIH